MVIVGVPETIILPPVVVPTAADRPALTLMASVEVEVVARFWARVMSPTTVSIRIVPAETTAFKVSPPLASVRDRFPVLETSPPLMDATLFEVLVKVMFPAP
jgi:hypothetical protein